MQLGRDAQSSGDNVMAESYFQFSEHYFRVMAAAQPVGQPTTQLRRPEDEDFEEGGDAAEGESDAAQAVSEGGQAGAGEQADSGGQSSGGDRQRDNRDGNRERFRPRWQNRGDQPRNGESEPRLAEAEPQMAQESGRPSGNVQDADTGQWEAPSFLRRPAPAEVADEPVAEKKGRNPRRARAVAAEDGE